MLCRMWCEEGRVRCGPVWQTQRYTQDSFGKHHLDHSLDEWVHRSIRPKISWRDLPLSKISTSSPHAWIDCTVSPIWHYVNLKGRWYSKQITTRQTIGTERMVTSYEGCVFVKELQNLSHGKNRSAIGMSRIV